MKKRGSGDSQLSWKEPFVVSGCFIDLHMGLFSGAMSGGVGKWVWIWRFQ